MSIYKVSVIIPVKNGAGTLHKNLQSLMQQTIANELEIIVLDSESTDDSVAICKQYNVTVYPILAKDFNHGLTRNFGVQKANAALVYFTVQDAWLAAPTMLQNMAAHFNNNQIQSVTGMQAIPHDKDKNPALWFKRSSEPFTETTFFLEGEFQKLNNNNQLQYCRWDNVNSMYRKTALITLPFVETNLSEDIIWAKQALEKGYAIMKDPSLVVYHYHHQTFSYNFRVNFSVFYANKKIFNVLPTYPKVILPLLRRFKTILFHKQISMWRKPYWLSHNLGMYMAHTFAVFFFRASIFFGGQSLLDKSLHFFCKQIPQGKLATQK